MDTADGKILLPLFMKTNLFGVDCHWFGRKFAYFEIDTSYIICCCVRQM